MKRRVFIRETMASGLAISAMPLITATFNTHVYRIALVGSGWWGMNILREALSYGNCTLVGICDVDERQLTQATEELNKTAFGKPRWFKDYRELIQGQKPDIVIVATPDHWHALCAIEAIKNGAHIYLEKPICHTLLEGKAILQAARHYKRNVQVGTHRRVSPHNLSAMQFLRSGKVGRISAVKCFVNYNQSPGRMQPIESLPDGLDWEMWCGPAPVNPYHAGIHPRGFRQYLDYANGQIGDWGIHWFDQVLWWTEERYPKTIYSTGHRFVREDNSDAPDTQYAVFDFESFTMTWEHKLCAANANEPTNVGCYFYGTEGTLHLGWLDGWTFFPSKKGAQTLHEDAQLHDPDQQNIKELWADFIRSIEENRRPECDIEDGFLATNMSLLAMVSYKLGRSIEWDGINHTTIRDEEAQKLLKRAYRPGWNYPEVF